jgi:hypothetical protein
MESESKLAAQAKLDLVALTQSNAASCAQAPTPMSSCF